MTNDLMRDVIEGRLPDPVRDWAQKVRRNGNDQRRIASRKLIPTAFTVPRERALRAKQHQSHGPDTGTLKERGRVTRYKTKG